MNTVFNKRNVIIAIVTLLVIGGIITAFLLLNKPDETKEKTDLTKITEEEAKKMTDVEIIDELTIEEEDIILDNQADDEIIDSLDSTIITNDDNYEIINN